MAIITLNTPGGADDVAIQTAIGRRDNLRDASGAYRLATVPEIKAHIANYLRGMTKEVDLEIKREQLSGVNVSIT